MKFFSKSVVATTALLASFHSVVRAEEESDDVLVLTKDNFDEQVKSGITLVKFYAPWCGHCKALAPEYEQAASELKDEDVHLAKIDCTTEGDICTQHGVQGYPTVKLFRDGNSSDYQKARKSDAIVSFMRKQLLPSLSEIKESSELTKLAEENKVVVVAYLESAVGDVYENYKAVADELREEFVFAIVTDAAIAKENEVDVPGFALNKQFDELKNVFPENVEPALIKQDAAPEEIFSVENLKAFIKTNSVPIMDDVGPDNYATYIDSGLPLGFFFWSGDEERAKYGPFVEAAAKKHRGKVNFVYIDAVSFGGHASNLNLKEEWPALAIQDTVGGSKFPFPQSEELSEESVMEFVDKFVSGELKPSIKSEPVPESNDEPVKVIVSDQFEELVMDKSKDAFIEFYAPWCGHCKRLAPTWETLGKKLKSVDSILIGKMDATENDIPPGLGFQVEGFPTLKLFKAETNEIVDYSGDRSLEGLLEFLKENAAKPFTVPEGEVEEESKDDEEEVPHGDL